MKKYQRVHTAFKAFRRNPTPQNRTKLVAAVCGACEVPQDHEVAHDLTATIINPANGASVIHKSLMSAANTVGVDVQTLGGGNTPDAK